MELFRVELSREELALPLKWVNGKTCGDVPHRDWYARHPDGGAAVTAKVLLEGSDSTDEALAKMGRWRHEAFLNGDFDEFHAGRLLLALRGGES